MVEINITDIDKGLIYLKDGVPYVKRGLKIVLNKYRHTHTCEICGKQHTEISPLTFHHTIPALKTDCITDMVYYGTSVNQFLKEVNTCQLLCRKCHDIIDGNVKNLKITIV